MALRFHLFYALRVIATCTLSLEKVGDSVLKLSISSKFVKHFPSTSFF